MIGEQAAGNPGNRAGILGRLRALPESSAAGHEEVMDLQEGKRLHGRGLGWVDLHLLASALVTGCRLWTRDRALRRVAGELKLDSPVR